MDSYSEVWKYLAVLATVFPFSLLLVIYRIWKLKKSEKMYVKIIYKKGLNVSLDKKYEVLDNVFLSPSSDAVISIRNDKGKLIELKEWQFYYV